MAKNEQAFPRSGNEWDSMELVPAKAENGMSLRDYFAAKAMQSLISLDWAETEADTCPTARRCIAGDAYEMADAMLEARK